MQLAQKCAVFQILLDKIHLYFRVSFPLMFGVLDKWVKVTEI